VASTVAENKIAAQAKQKAQLLASQEMTTKKALLDKANAGTDLAAIEQAQADYDAATKALSVVNLELEQAKSDLKGSEDNSEAMKVAAAATAASLLKLQDELSKIADDATQKAQKAESRRISLIQQKREEDLYIYQRTERTSRGPIHKTRGLASDTCTHVTNTCSHS
jgi:hypothetical protein